MEGKPEVVDVNDDVGKRLGMETVEGNAGTLTPEKFEKLIEGTGRDDDCSVLKPTVGKTMDDEKGLGKRLEGSEEVVGKRFVGRAGEEVETNGEAAREGRKEEDEG